MKVMACGDEDSLKKVTSFLINDSSLPILKLKA
jgi:hypothetical protein